MGGVQVRGQFRQHAGKQLERIWTRPALSVTQRVHVPFLGKDPNIVVFDLSREIIELRRAKRTQTVVPQHHQLR